MADNSMQVFANDDDATTDSVPLDEEDFQIADSIAAPLDPVAALAEETLTSPSYNVVPDPEAERVDLSELRGVANNQQTAHLKLQKQLGVEEEDGGDLENLAELVPNVKARLHGSCDFHHEPILTSTPKVLDDHGGNVEVVEQVGRTASTDQSKYSPTKNMKSPPSNKHDSPLNSKTSLSSRKFSMQSNRNDQLAIKSPVEKIGNLDRTSLDKAEYVPKAYSYHQDDVDFGDSTSFDDDYDVGSDHHIGDNTGGKIPKEFLSANMGSSAQSISTATQTHEVVSTQICFHS